MNASNRRVPCWSLCPKTPLQMFLESTAQLWWAGVEKPLTRLFEMVTGIKLAERLLTDLPEDGL